MSREVKVIRVNNTAAEQDALTRLDYWRRMYGHRKDLSDSQAILLRRARWLLGLAAFDESPEAAKLDAARKKLLREIEHVLG